MITSGDNLNHGIIVSAQNGENEITGVHSSYSITGASSNANSSGTILTFSPGEDALVDREVDNVSFQLSGVVSSSVTIKIQDAGGQARTIIVDEHGVVTKSHPGDSNVVAIDNGIISVSGLSDVASVSVTTSGANDIFLQNLDFLARPVEPTELGDGDVKYLLSVIMNNEDQTQEQMVKKVDDFFDQRFKSHIETDLSVPESENFEESIGSGGSFVNAFFGNQFVYTMSKMLVSAFFEKNNLAPSGTRGEVLAAGFIERGALGAFKASGLSNSEGWNDGNIGNEIGDILNLAAIFPVITEFSASAYSVYLAKEYVKSIDYIQVRQELENYRFIQDELPNLDLKVKNAANVQDVKSALLDAYSSTSEKIDHQISLMDGSIDRRQIKIENERDTIRYLENEIESTELALYDIGNELLAHGDPTGNLEFNFDNLKQDLDNFQEQLEMAEGRIRTLNSEIDSIERMKFQAGNDRDYLNAVSDGYAAGNGQVTDLAEHSKIVTKVKEAAKSFSPVLFAGVGVAAFIEAASGEGGVDAQQIAGLSIGTSRQVDGFALALLEAFGDTSKGTVKNVATGLDGLGGVLAGAEGAIQIASIVERLESAKEAGDERAVQLITAELAMQTITLSAGIAEGVVSVINSVALTGSSLAKVTTVLGGIFGAATSILSAINPAQWLAFEQSQKEIDHYLQLAEDGDDVAGEVADLKGDLLEVEKGLYGAEAAVSVLTGTTAATLSASGIGTIPGVIVGIIGGAIQGILQAIKQPLLERMVDDKRAELIATYESIDKFFDEKRADAYLNFAQETFSEAFAEQFEADPDLDNIVAIGSQYAGLSELELAALIRADGDEMKETASAYHHDINREGEWTEVDIEEASVINLSELHDGAKQYLTFTSPLMASGEEQRVRIETGKNQYNTVLTLENSSLGWVMKDSWKNVDTVFNPDRMVTSFQAAQGAVIQQAKLTIHAFDGDDTLIASDASVQFDGGNGYDIASYSSFTGSDFKNRGIVVYEDSEGLVVEKNFDKGKEYYKETIGTYEAEVGKRKEIIEYRDLEIARHDGQTTVKDKLSNIETLVGSAGDDLINILNQDTGSPNGQLQEIALLDGDDTAFVGGDIQRVYLGDGDDLLYLDYSIVQRLKHSVEREANQSQAVQKDFIYIHGGENVDDTDVVVLGSEAIQDIFSIGAITRLVHNRAENALSSTTSDATRALVTNTILSEALELEGNYETKLLFDAYSRIVVENVDTVQLRFDDELIHGLGGDGGFFRSLQSSSPASRIEVSVDAIQWSLAQAFSTQLDERAARNDFRLGLDFSQFNGEVETKFTYDSNHSIELIGTDFDDELIGGNKADIISGGDGRDTIYARGGNNTLFGGDRSDPFSVDINVATNSFAAAAGWGESRYERTVGDVNGDGRADIVAFGYGSVFVHLGQTDGTFGKSITAYNQFTVLDGWGKSKYERTLGDINGDGRVDIVAFGEEYVSAALGQTDGTFGQSYKAYDGFSAKLGWGDSRYERTVGDVNGDGRADIVAFQYNNVFVSLGQTDGTFGEKFRAHDQFVVRDGWGESKYERTLGDINGDGRVDIVGFGEKYVWAALGQTNGTFGQFYRAKVGEFVEPYGWGDSRYERTVGDVNGDGRVDIVAFGEDYVYTALGQTNGLFGESTIVTNEFVASDGWGLDLYKRTLGDVDGNGKTDIVAFGRHGVQVGKFSGEGVQVDGDEDHFIFFASNDVTTSPKTDTIADFELGIDKIVFTGRAVNGWEDLSISRFGLGSKVDYDHGDIILANIEPGQLNDDDFIFA